MVLVADYLAVGIDPTRATIFGYLRAVLRDGSDAARGIAQTTLRQVAAAMHTNYWLDPAAARGVAHARGARLTAPASAPCRRRTPPSQR